MKQCPACGANNSSDLPSCSICGASLSQVAESAAARTLFGMPALKIDQLPETPAAKPESDEPKPLPGAVPGPATKRGFRALDAVELDGSIGSMDARSVDADIRSTQFGAPSPFTAGQLPPLEEDEPIAPSGREPISSAPAPDSPILSTQFGAPSPFKAGRVPSSGAPEAAPEPEPEPDINSTRVGMPSMDLRPGAPEARGASDPPGAASQPPAGQGEQQYRTLVGPPLPLAEAARARDAARKQQTAEAPQDNYRTLVGPPVPIAEAARARDAARKQQAKVRSEGLPSDKPSVIVGDELARKEADSAPSVIVDEPVPERSPQPSGKVDRIPPGGRVARPPGATEISGASGDAERAAAARFAAAMDTDEHTAMVVAIQPKGYRWLVFLLLIVAGIALALWLTRDAAAYEARVEAVEVSPVDDRLAFAVDVRSDGPVTVRHPGGAAAVDGGERIEFELDAEQMKPGTSELALTVDADGERATLPLEVTLWYRARVDAVEAVGAPIPVELSVRPGWRPVGDVTPIAGGERHRLTIDPTRALAAVDGPGGVTTPLTETVKLRDDGGAEAEFPLTVQAPLPRTPLTITAPPRLWRRAADQVAIAGRTAPGAEVRVGAVTTHAGPDGAFRLVAPLGGAREQVLEVIADAPGARSTVQRITVERLTAEAGREQAAALRADQAGRLGRIEPAPPYARWLPDAEKLRGRAVEFSGRLVAVERGIGRRMADDRAVIATCDRGEHCPVWVSTAAPILVDVGARVTVSGRLAGAETWRTAERFVTAPRVEGALIAP